MSTESGGVSWKVHMSTESGNVSFDWNSQRFFKVCILNFIQYRFKINYIFHLFTSNIFICIYIYIPVCQNSIVIFDLWCLIITYDYSDITMNFFLNSKLFKGPAIRCFHSTRFTIN